MSKSPFNNRHGCSNQNGTRFFEYMARLREWNDIENIVYDVADRYHPEYIHSDESSGHASLVKHIPVLDGTREHLITFMAQVPFPGLSIRTKSRVRWSFAIQFSVILHVGSQQEEEILNVSIPFKVAPNQPYALYILSDLNRTISAGQKIPFEFMVSDDTGNAVHTKDLHINASLESTPAETGGPVRDWTAQVEDGFASFLNVDVKETGIACNKLGCNHTVFVLSFKLFSGSAAFDDTPTVRSNQIFIQHLEVTELVFGPALSLTWLASAYSPEVDVKAVDKYGNVAHNSTAPICIVMKKNGLVLTHDANDAFPPVFMRADDKMYPPSKDVRLGHTYFTLTISTSLSTDEIILQFRYNCISQGSTSTVTKNLGPLNMVTLRDYVFPDIVVASVLAGQHFSIQPSIRLCNDKLGMQIVRTNAAQNLRQPLLLSSLRTSRVVVSLVLLIPSVI